MPNRRIEDSAKLIAIRLLERGRDTRPEIAKLCDLSLRTLGRTTRRFCTTGSVAKAAAIGRGRPLVLHNRDSAYLLKLAKHNPCYFLDEYQQFLDRYRHMPVHISTVHRAFERAGLRVKRVQRMASEIDPLAESHFINRISHYPAHYLVALDEMSKDDRTYARLWGRSPQGERTEVYYPFVRKRRFTGIGALALDVGMIASRVIEGSADRETFIEFLRDDVVRLGID
ncbi:hypothetical protein R3P38DRAFT_2567237 [Favolaschia claudopus]|uniref:Transposase n=1 Tax=Favolaschia claudopus TaxID=2862362 RepID=A0AAV9ZXF6_9AGAR